MAIPASLQVDITPAKEGIRLAMQIGAQNNEANRATFRWTTQRTYTQVDQGGDPYDWDDTPTDVDAHEDVQIDVAVEFGSAVIDGTALGQFDTSKGEITVLGDDYPLVKGADQVIIDGNTYVINSVRSRGLFGLDVYFLDITALDLSTGGPQ